MFRYLTNLLNYIIRPSYRSMDSTNDSTNDSELENADISEQNENNTRNDQVSLEEDYISDIFGNLNLNDNTRYSIPVNDRINDHSSIEQICRHYQRMDMVRKRLFHSRSNSESDLDCEPLDSVQQSFGLNSTNEMGTTSPPNLDLRRQQLFDSSSCNETDSENNSLIRVAQKLIDSKNTVELSSFVTNDSLPVARKRSNKPSTSNNEQLETNDNEECPRKKKRRLLRRSRSVGDETPPSFKLHRKNNRKCRARRAINRKRLRYSDDSDGIGQNAKFSFS